MYTALSMMMAAATIIALTNPPGCGCV